MLKIRFRKQFRKDYKRVIKQPGHTLSGDYAGFRECHILPDWLLIYKIETDILTLTLTRTGSHSDLF